jgi:hypothetical protein
LSRVGAGSGSEDNAESSGAFNVEGDCSPELHDIAAMAYIMKNVAGMVLMPPAD